MTRMSLSFDKHCWMSNQRKLLSESIVSPPTDKNRFLQAVKRLICCVCTTASKLDHSASAGNTSASHIVRRHCWNCRHTTNWSQYHSVMDWTSHVLFLCDRKTHTLSHFRKINRSSVHWQHITELLCDEPNQSIPMCRFSEQCTFNYESDTQDLCVWKQLCKGEKHLKTSQVLDWSNRPLMSQLAKTQLHLKHSRGRQETAGGWKKMCVYDSLLSWRMMLNQNVLWV